MAKSEKYKTKYTKPKDLEASQTKAFIKKEVRKAIKDYTHEDKDGGMNPYSTKEAQTNVLRKRDKLVIDDVDNMVPKDKDVAKYYKVEGDHDPKYTKNEREKIQNEDEKDSKEEIKDKIENLTREQKERFVREYVKMKIKNILTEKKNAKPDFLDVDKDEKVNEQPTPGGEEIPTPEEETPTPEEETPTPEEETPTPEETPEEETPTPEEEETNGVSFKYQQETQYYEWLQKQPTAGKLTSTLNVLNHSLSKITNTDEIEARDKIFNKAIDQLRTKLNIPTNSITKIS